MATITMTDIVSMRLDFFEIARFFKLFNDGFSAFVTGHPLIFPRILVHNRPVVHNADYGKIVAKPHLEVVRVVRGRDFNRAGTEFKIYVIVRNDGNFSTDKRKNKRFADEVFISRIFRINRNGSVPEHGFGTSRRDDEIFVAVFEVISEMP